jgi:hypothetical protein
MSRIFNLVAPEDFQLAGYRFVRVADYDRAIEMLPKRGGVTSAKVVAPDGGRYWVRDKENRQGINVHTFNASWVGDGAEPMAALVKEAPLLADILLLLTTWGERRVFHRSDKIDPTESPYYWPDWYIVSDVHRFEAVEAAITRLRTEKVPQFPFNKVLHLLIESDQSSVAEVKGLIFMPCLDLVCAATAPNSSCEWTDEQQAEIGVLRKKLLAVLDEAKDPRVKTIAAGPFRSDIQRLGSDRAADKLINYYRWALDWLRLPDAVIVSHARALNAVRNALVHRAASPEKISVEFTGRPPVIIPKDDPPEHLLRAELYLTLINQAIVKRHASSLLKLNPALLAQLDADLRNFFERGIYNDVRVFEEWFQDRIIG